MTVVHGVGKFSHLLRPCTRNAITMQSSPLNKDKLKRLLFSTYFAESIRHSVIPSGIVYTVLWSSSVAIVLWLYTCNLPTWLLAREEQTGQDSMSMSSHYLKMLHSADKHLTRRLFRYAGIGAILINGYLHILVPKLSVPTSEKDVGKLSSKCA